MRRILLFSVLLASFAVIRGQEPDSVINCHYTDVALNEFLEDISSNTGIKIFYDRGVQDNLKVNVHSDSITIFSAVAISLEGTGLSVSKWHRNLVITRGAGLISSLPEYLMEKEVTVSIPEKEVVTESEERYKTGRKAAAPEFLRIGEGSLIAGGNKVNILGRVIEAETGEPLIGAVMLVNELQTGAITDYNGRLSMVIIPGIYNVSFEFVGFESKKFIMEVISSDEFTVSLSTSVISIDEVIILGDRQGSVTARDPGLEKISPLTVKEIPAMLGERDIIKVTEMLPGIVTVGEGSTGLNVRGGSSDQNAFYINRVPVYNVSHMFGFFPSFNADIVKDFSVYKGHIPAQFGGRLSSVFNIITRQGNRKEFNMHGGLSPVAANITIEGPIKKDVSSALLSVRSSYSDWILRMINDPVIRTSSARFNDIALSANYDFEKTQTGLFLYSSYDQFSLSDLNNYNYANLGGSLNFRRTFGTNLYADMTIIGSRYSFGTTDKKDPSVSFSHNYALEHYEGRIDMTQITISGHTLEYGVELLWDAQDRGSVTPYGDGSLITPLSLGKERGAETSVYLSDVIDVFPWLNVSAGARFSLFVPLGGKKVYKYQDGAPHEPLYIIDSAIYGKNEPISWYKSPEFRFTANFVTGTNSSLKLAFNQMHQNIFMLSNTIIIAPNTQWKLADYYLKPAKGIQYSAGFFKNFPGSGWESSLEAFYKSTGRFPEFRDGADFLDGSEIEALVLQGDQRSYGIELFIRRSGHELNGWFAYTWSRSVVKIDGGSIWNSVNRGRTYPSNYDIPHAFNGLLNYQFTRRIGMSAAITYQTGRPVTYPLSVYYVDGVPVTDYSARNEYNIPDYFRIDFSLSLEGNLKRDKLIHNSLSINVYNLTGRKNPYSVYFQSVDGELESYKYSIIGVPLFTATWIFKLGNYASE